MPVIHKVLGHAPMITLKVDAETIARSCVRNGHHCMVAEALKKQYPNLSYIAADIQTIRATDLKKRERYIWITPRNVQQLIIDFDQGKKPAPFKINMRVGQILESGNGMPLKKKGERKPRAKAQVGVEKNHPRIAAIVGGKAPPRSPIGFRREFGVRALTK